MKEPLGKGADHNERAKREIPSRDDSLLYGSEGPHSGIRTHLRRVLSLRRLGGRKGAAEKPTEGMRDETSSTSIEISKLTAEQRKAEFARLKQLVSSSADAVVADLATHSQSQAEHPLGHLAQALVDTEGIATAHARIRNAMVRLNLPNEKGFYGWLELYKKGDKDALPLARGAALSGAKVAAFTRIDSAEKVATLVEAGDREAIPVARSMAKEVLVTERATLFGKLYMAGDVQSLDLALLAAREAKAHTEATGERQYHQSEQALSEMASHAVEKGNVTDMLALMRGIESESTRALLHAKLFANGRKESLQSAVDFLSTTDSSAAYPVERSLAEAGYAPALETIKKRVATATGPLNNNRIMDLLALHNSKDATAAAKLAELIHADKHPEYWVEYLGVVGLREERRTVATQAYTVDQSVSNAINLLRAQYATGVIDSVVWQKVFDHWKDEKSSPLGAAALIALLAEQAKALNV